MPRSERHWYWRGAKGRAGMGFPASAVVNYPGPVLHLRLSFHLCHGPGPHLRLSSHLCHGPVRMPVVFPSPAVSAHGLAPAAPELPPAAASVPCRSGPAAGEGLVPGLISDNPRGPGAGTGDGGRQGRFAVAAPNAGYPVVADSLPGAPASFSFDLTPVFSAPPAAGRCCGPVRCAAGSGSAVCAATAAVLPADTGPPCTLAGKRGVARAAGHRRGSTGPSLSGAAPISGPSADPSGGANHAASRGSTQAAVHSSARGLEG